MYNYTSFDEFSNVCPVLLSTRFLLVIMYEYLVYLVYVTLMLE